MGVKISIITVCRNSAKTVGKTIDSVIDQNYADVEHIIIDGASTDETLQVVNDHLKRAPYQYSIVSEPDNGIYDAMNKGIRLATGDLICMLNSDDWLEDGALKTVDDNYNGEDYLVIYGMERRIRDDKEVGCFLYGHELIPERSLAHQACYVTKKVYDRFGVYETGYRSAGDHEFFLRLYMSSEVDFRPVYKILANFREGGMTATSIGHLEDAKVRRKYGVITGKQYTYLFIRALLLKILKRC